MVAGGQVIEHTADTPAGEGRPGGGRRRWIRPAVVGAIVAACVGVGAYATANEVQANRRFDATHRSLDATRRHLGLVRADLTTVRADLQVVDGQIGLDTATLAQDTTQLQGLEAALAADRAGVANQTSTTHDLQACLAGVEQGLNALSVGDQAHAIRALNAVSATCNAVVAADG